MYCDKKVYELHSQLINYDYPQDYYDSEKERLITNYKIFLLPIQIFLKYLKKIDEKCNYENRIGSSIVYYLKNYKGEQTTLWILS